VARGGWDDVQLGEAREDVKRTPVDPAKLLVASKCAGVASIAGLTANRERGGGLDERALGGEVGKERGGRGFDPKGCGGV